MGLSGSLRCGVLLAYLSMTASFAPQVPPATPLVPLRCRPAPRSAVLGVTSRSAPQGEAPQKAQRPGQSELTDVVVLQL